MEQLRIFWWIGAENGRGVREYCGRKCMNHVYENQSHA
jgi:hypothetical protein